MPKDVPGVKKGQRGGGYEAVKVGILSFWEKRKWTLFLPGQNMSPNGKLPLQSDFIFSIFAHIFARKETRKIKITLCVIISFI
jgi:hypothetical protein